MEIKPRQIIAYQTPKSKIPFNEWLDDLHPNIQPAIRRRIDRLRLGDFGDCKSLSEGVHEMRIHIGAGYRVYFGMDGDILVILLTGGDKSSQVKDIKKAKEYFNEYKERTHPRRGSI